MAALALRDLMCEDDVVDVEMKWGMPDTLTKGGCLAAFVGR